MSDESDTSESGGASRDGLTAIAIIVLTELFIVFVVSNLI